MNYPLQIVQEIVRIPRSAVFWGVAQIEALRQGEPLSFGVDHPDYHHVSVVEDRVRAALIADLA